MCGIVGILGESGAYGFVRDGLQMLEYRGYDSAGIAWLADSKLDRVRSVGAVRNLPTKDVATSMAIGHTRWATHGGVEERNAHPHVSNHGDVAVVHNGTIFNHETLRVDLKRIGCTFESDTDSEVLAHLWSTTEGDGLTRLLRCRASLTGTYSVAFLTKEAIFVAKHRNPMWVAHENGVACLASDAIALKSKFQSAAPLEDGDYGVLTQDGIQLYDRSGKPVVRESIDLSSLIDAEPLGGFEHYMRKEIHEAPSVLNRVIQTYVDPSGPKVLGRPLERALLLGAGTSYYASVLGARFLKTIAHIPAEARMSPEWKDDPEIPDRATTVIACTQSGETLDTVQALHKFHHQPHHLLSLTNYPLSTIGRRVHKVLPLQSGTEVSVASTKTYLAQVLILELMARETARFKRVIPHHEHQRYLENLTLLPRTMQRVLDLEADFQVMAEVLSQYERCFILGKADAFPVCLEAALKFKEIPYLHAEAYPSGELKHGPFALLDERTACLFLVGTQCVDQVENAIEEVKARGAPVLVVQVADGNHAVQTLGLVEVPLEQETEPVYRLRLPRVPGTEVYALAMASHLLAYWVARHRGLAIDKPRNLAKSVTVE